jgi:bifunctional DNase/RNase
MDLVEVELVQVVIQHKGEQQYVHLQEKGGGRRFPIVIGYHEVEEINRKLIGQQTQRPLTHDLVGRLLRTLAWRLVRVIITELREGTFYANLVVLPSDLAAGKEQERTVDCRPSDAIALAVQTAAPIFVAREVIDEVAQG